ncbi:ribose 5-phosphate isomerase B [candidate division KSB1 bacterium]|nr:ribose 5-phosphate isomerase B [candidate division KSB1 bacterium]
MSIAVGADHAGYELKEKVKEYLEKMDIKVRDFGCFSNENADYPDYAVKVAKSIVAGENEWGILICGTGIGISITANKIKGIRAALCCSEYMAKMARKHNNANILAMGGRTTSSEEAEKMIAVFLETEFEGGRHADRVKKIHDLTGK